MNLDLNLIERTGYTVLEILSDIGGLQGILISAISLLLSVLNYNYLDDYLVAKLFKSESKFTLHAQPIFGRIKEFCIAKLIPRKLVCCRKEQNKFAMEQARESLSKESDIIKMFRTQRFLQMALKHLLDPALRKELKTRSKYKEIIIETKSREL